MATDRIKYIAFKASEAQYEQLRRIAYEQHVSIAKACRVAVSLLIERFPAKSE